MRLDYHVLDVFTDTRFGGNPLAVVLEADDLDGARMQAIAREFNLSETVFVLKPREQGAHGARAHLHAERRVAVRRAPDGRHGRPAGRDKARRLRRRRSAGGAGGADRDHQGRRAHAGRRGRRSPSSMRPSCRRRAGALPSADRLAGGAVADPGRDRFREPSADEVRGRQHRGVRAGRFPGGDRQGAGRLASLGWRHEGPGAARRVSLLPADGAHHLVLSCALLRPRFRRARGPGDRVGGRRVCRRHSPLRRTAGRAPTSASSSRATRWDGRASSRCRCKSTRGKLDTVRIGGHAVRVAEGKIEV